MTTFQSPAFTCGRKKRTNKTGKLTMVNIREAMRGMGTDYSVGVDGAELNSDCGVSGLLGSLVDEVGEFGDLVMMMH